MGMGSSWRHEAFHVFESVNCLQEEQFSGDTGQQG